MFYFTEYGAYYLGPNIEQRPVYVAVAEPIEVEKADLDANGDLMDLSLLEKYHKKYMESLEKLFEDCKHLAGYPKERKLEII